MGGNFIDDLQYRYDAVNESKTDDIASVEKKLQDAVSELEKVRTDLALKGEECTNLQERMKNQPKLKGSSQLSNLRRLMEEQQNLLIQRDASLCESQLQVEKLLKENER